MQHDFWKVSLFLIAALAVGLTFGYAAEITLIAALIVIVWQMLRFDLIYRWIQSPNKNPLPETSGQIYELHSELNRRIKKNRRRKVQLRKHVKQFRQTISAIPDAIIIVDDEGAIQWANRNADSLLGIRWPNDAKLRFSDLIRDPKVRSLLDTSANTRSVNSQSSTSNDVIEISSPNNFEQIISVKAVQYDQHTRMLIARDVSRLVKVNRMHRDFVANVSHELKTPLTVLRGYLEILLSRPELDQHTNKALTQMNSQSERMQLIVNDLLYLSKLEDELNISKTETIDVTHLINNIMETASATIANKSHKVQLDIDYRLQLIGNPNELHSAFSNLIANAVNYTQANGVIEIRWQQDDGSGIAMFSVSDNGQGIPGKDIARLTERFYRIDDDRSRENGGTGLGLAIVKHVLQRHNAELDIDSKEGKGSTFTCVFPSHKVAKNEDLKENAVQEVSVQP